MKTKRKLDLIYSIGMVIILGVMLIGCNPPEAVEPTEPTTTEVSDTLNCDCGILGVMDVENYEDYEDNYGNVIVHNNSSNTYVLYGTVNNLCDDRTVKLSLVDIAVKGDTICPYKWDE